jgi:hypothetical protein
MRVSLLGVTVMALLARLADAQTTDPRLSPGTVVRVSSRNGDVSRVVGTVQSLLRDTLLLRDQFVRLAVSDLAELDVREPVPRRTGRGFVIGLLIGAAAATVGTVAKPPKEAIPENEAWQLGIIVTGGLVGGGIGALLGSFPTTRWVPIPLPLGRG